MFSARAPHVWPDASAPRTSARRLAIMQRVDVNAGSDDELRARTHGLRLGPDLVERIIRLRAEQAFTDESPGALTTASPRRSGSAR